MRQVWLHDYWYSGNTNRNTTRVNSNLFPRSVIYQVLGHIIIILMILKYDYVKRDRNKIYSLEEMAVTNQKIGEVLTRIPKGSVSLRYLDTQFKSEHFSR